ncbi:hypothetical protein QJQ45_030249, partial [Haematococcus lacustris]
AQAVFVAEVEAEGDAEASHKQRPTAGASTHRLHADVCEAGGLEVRLKPGQSQMMHKRQVVQLGTTVTNQATTALPVRDPAAAAGAAQLIAEFAGKTGGTVQERAGMAVPQETPRPTEASGDVLASAPAQGSGNSQRGVLAGLAAQLAAKRGGRGLGRAAAGRAVMQGLDGSTKAAAEAAVAADLEALNSAGQRQRELEELRREEAAEAKAAAEFAARRAGQDKQTALQLKLGY